MAGNFFMPKLYWLNSGKGRLGFWPVLGFESYEDAKCSGLEMPPPYSEEAKEIELSILSMRQSNKEEIVMNMLGLNVWSCLSSTSSRLVPYDGRNVSKEVEFKENSSSFDENVVAVFKRAVKDAEKIRQYGFNKWLADEESISSVLKAVDVASTTMKWDAYNQSDQSEVERWFAMKFPLVTQTASVAEFCSIKNDLSTRWVSKFVKLFDFVSERNIVSISNENHECDPRLKSEKEFSPKCISELVEEREIGALTGIKMKGYHSGIIQVSKDVCIDVLTINQRSVCKELCQQVVKAAVLKVNSTFLNEVSHEKVQYLPFPNGHTGEILNKALHLTKVIKKKFIYIDFM